MTGDEHYREAERLLDGPDEGLDDWETLRADNLAAAQVHATLALAAATLDAAFTRTPGPDSVFVDDARQGWGYGR